MEWVIGLIVAVAVWFVMWRKLKKTEEKHLKQSNIFKSEISMLRTRDRDANATLTRYEKENIKHKDMAVLFPEIVKMILSATTSEELSKFIMRGINRLVLCENIAVFFADKSAEKLELVHVRGLEEILSKPLTVNVGDGHVGYAAETGIIIEEKVLRKESDLMKKQVSKNAIPGFIPEMTVPMMFRGTLYGVICVVDISARANIPKTNLRSVAAIAAVALHNIRLLSRFMSAADLDEVTGLQNIGQYEPALVKELERAMRNEKPLTVMELNIPAGSNADDYLARESITICVNYLKKTFRNIDTGFRLSSETIGILLPGTNTAGATKIRNVLLQNIPELTNEEGKNIGMVKVRYKVMEADVRIDAETVLSELHETNFES